MHEPVVNLRPRPKVLPLCCSVAAVVLVLSLRDSSVTTSFHCRTTTRGPTEPVCFHSAPECRGAYEIDKFECFELRVAWCFRTHYSSPTPPSQIGEWDECYPTLTQCATVASVRWQWSQHERLWSNFDEKCRPLEVSAFVPYPWPYWVREGPNGSILADPRAP